MTVDYNALGQRMVKASGSTVRVYAVDEAGRPLGVYVVDASQTNGFRTEEEYVHLDGWRPVAVVRPDANTGMANPQIFPILTDHLGTPRKVLDGNTGQVRWSWDAKQPFGHEMPNETPTASQAAFAFDLRFPGQRYDEETGLFHNGFRDYHSGLGRYVQSDPLGLEAGWNTYNYIDSSPLKFIDPNGLLKRDNNGNIIQQETPGTWQHCEQGKCVVWKNVVIYTDKGRAVTGYKYISGYEGYKQNCHSYALGVNLWIDNPWNIYEDEYERVSSPVPGDITFYTGGWTSNKLSPSHSSIFVKNSPLGPINFGKWGKRETPSYEHHWWTMTGKYSPIYLRRKNEK